MSAAPSAPQTPAPAASSHCDSLLIPQQAAARSRKRPYYLRLHAVNGAEMTYFGVRHTYDPTDTQFVSMQREFAALKPTLVFYEGAGTTKAQNAENADDAIRADGEPGLARFLARQGEATARSLEPSRTDEVAALLKHFSSEELVLFYTLRPMTELRVRRGVIGRSLDSSLVSQLVFIHRTPGLRDALPDTAALHSAFARRFPGVDMMTLPDSWFNPALLPTDDPRRLFNAINYESSMFRDSYMYRLLASAALDSAARVFAEVGRDHIPAQAAALECALETVQREE